MAKIDLKKLSGFPLMYENDTLVMPDLSCIKQESIFIDQMRDQLLNQDLSSPELFYKKFLQIDHDNIFTNKKLRVNLYLVQSNLAGIEYVKTRAARLSNYPKVGEIIYGSATLIMQKMGKEHSVDVILTKMKKGQKFIVPPGYAFTIINTKQSPLVVLEAYCSEARHTYVLDEMQGMAYYVIRKNARQEIVRNPNYKEIGKFRKVNWDNLIPKQNITFKTPIVKQILRKYEKFNWLFKESSFQI